MTTIKIHEFSTGIKAQISADGTSWVSQQFKVGEFINSTLKEIPDSVKEAIRNNRFQVAEGAYSSEPAVVGRVVLNNRQGEGNWSVVAVVTRGTDNRRRSFPAYRYFLCEGADKLWVILDWMKKYSQNDYSRLPIFNPGEVKLPEQPHVHDVVQKPKCNLGKKWDNFLEKEPGPIILEQGNKSTIDEIFILNEMAERKANGYTVSWAYNVEALEKPESFIIVQAASDEAYQHLIRIRQYLISNPRILPPAGVDEASIKSAVKGLINSSQIKRENIQIIVSELQGGKVPQEFWQDLFAKLGANSALQGGSVHPNDVRLLTLRAIVLPDTLSEFLQWLDIKGDIQKQTRNQQVSLEFRKQLLQYSDQFPDWKKRIEQMQTKISNSQSSSPPGIFKQGESKGAGGSAAVGFAAGAAGQLLFQVAANISIWEAVSRVAGWAILGGFLGWGMAWFVPNFDSRCALIGGSFGGAAGALGFLLTVCVFGNVAGRFAGAAMLGFFIGLMIALVRANASKFF